MASGGGSSRPVTINSSHLRVLKGHIRTVTALDVAHSFGYLISTSHDGTLHVWEYTTGKILYTLHHHEEFKCLVYRKMQNDVLIGTQVSINTRRENFLFCFQLETPRQIK